MLAGDRKGCDVDGHAAMRDCQTLSRIVATLLALAVLAERASTRSLPVRWLVLTILRQAESVAWEFVGAARQAPETRNGPEDAILLASRFRALAAALGALLCLARRFARWSTTAVCFAPRSGRLPVASRDWTRKPNDTS